MSKENQECCPKFDPEKWDKQTYHWDNKPFIKETVPTLFHMPFPSLLSKRITKLCKLAEEAKLAVKSEDALLLFRDPSAFKSEIYLSVTAPLSGADNVNLSGTFVARTFAGPYNAVPKFIKQMNEYLASQNQTAKDYYIHYAYCPKCAKKYGDNYMIIFANI